MNHRIYLGNSLEILKKPYGTDPIRGVYIMSEKPSKAEVMTEVIKDSVFQGNCRSGNETPGIYI